MDTSKEQQHIDRLEAEAYQKKREELIRRVELKRKTSNLHLLSKAYKQADTRESFEDWVKRVGGEGE